MNKDIKNNTKYNNFSEIEKLYELNKTKVPIYKGCPNKECFCTGDCKEVIGYRDKLPNEY